MKTKHKWTSILMSLAISVSAVFSPLLSNSNALAAAEGPKVDAPSALLIDTQSKQVIFSKNENEKRYPASTTKIMTMLLTMEAVQKGEKKLTDIVPVPLEAYNMEGSSVWLDPKEKFTLEDMLKFIAVPSGNDAAMATAIFIGGSSKAFVDRMNQKAKELGMTGTHYANPDGLHDPNHYTTAHDLAIVATELIVKYPQILELTKIKSFEMRNGKNFIENTNHLLGQYEGMDGLKTGFTDEAGYCLVSTAQREQHRLLGIILGAKTDLERQTDTRNLLDFGFTNFKTQVVAKKDEPISEKAIVANAKDEEVTVAPASDFYLTVKNGDDQGIETKYVWNPVEAPFAKGQVLGQMQKVKNGKVLNSVNLVSTQDVVKGSWFRLFFRKIFAGISSSLHNIFK